MKYDFKVGDRVISGTGWGIGIIEDILSYSFYPIYKIKWGNRQDLVYHSDTYLTPIYDPNDILKDLCSK